ncbi:SAM-dependent methyltransferase [Lachnoclostridium sp.]|uniref:SAM-dependent methyltransferase n=1 Tax=Lachnoclostridium sp. TaxID=2028282 RepID=UPI0028A0C756|nr:SAM-dependent methyltransferase [Lachnoclostridium sp.]
MDKLLNIQTEGIQRDGKDTYHFHRYEPTPYEVLDQLFHAYPLSKDDILVDFGCGKGRLNFYIHHRFHCKTVGVEYNDDFYQCAIKNLESYNSSKKEEIQFESIYATAYEVGENDSVFYFFNPFSFPIFSSVVHHILDSVLKYPRKVSLILYYPDEEYTNFLNQQTPFQLEKDVEVYAIHSNDTRDRYMIYSYDAS